MNTLFVLIFIIAILVNIFMYKKAEYIWTSRTAWWIFWGVLVSSFILAFSVATDLGLYSGSVDWTPIFPVFFVLNLGLVSVLSFAFSIYDGFDFDIPDIKVAAPIKIIVEVVGFIASILGIISFFLK